MHFCEKKVFNHTEFRKYSAFYAAFGVLEAKYCMWNFCRIRKFDLFEKLIEAKAILELHHMKGLFSVFMFKYESNLLI
jgi:hypothetical protein